MLTLFKKPVLNVKKERYLSLIIIIAPLLNFLSGITFDLHAPSLPAIASFFSAPISAAKNTITISLLGFAIGSLVFGTLLDIFGRRPIILLAMLLYTLASFAAVFANSIEQLLLIRFIQGFACSCASIGCRTILIESFSGHEFKVAMLYSSLAFSIGPIVAPFVGGILQFHYGWRANFIAYGSVSLLLMIMVACYIGESKKVFEKFSFAAMMNKYRAVIRHHAFFIGVFICGLSQILLLIYTVTGAFLVETVLHYSPITYGNTALIISCGYLFGTLSNRFLIKSFTMQQLIYLGFVLLFTGLGILAAFAIWGQFNLFTLILPLTLIAFSQGFIYINVLTHCLGISPNAGIATALFITATVSMGTLGTSIINYFNVTNLLSLTLIFAVLSLLELLVFMLFSKRLYHETSTLSLEGLQKVDEGV